ncbi:MAG: bifunctional DNA primase/polymerase [Alphaproteobacteria bacterium]|nr:bifunctional DNA primase/polymerase [Alphaproteobacteria bacterium]MBU1526913.1 bifunctional DNA primase/polymerase [Alphaproteobacteria bacterium]MBU2352503.1 bifunctional DNA primase/polymerase [Alphaproteobacteria bacterium]MBU2382005.1 bifunctional DNA primase/polymerase [Alphaproteobacteria bacterium]
MIGVDYAPLPSGCPPMAPSMSSGCAYRRALATLTAKTGLSGRLRAFALSEPGGRPPPNWKRRASDSPAAFTAWARSYPDAELALRTGVSTGLVVVQADDEATLAAAEGAFGPLPGATVRSVSRDGRLRVWMRVPSGLRTLPTVLNLYPGVRVLSDGAYCRLSEWTQAPDDPAYDYMLIPSGWTAAVQAALQAAAAPPTPTVRRFH